MSRLVPRFAALLVVALAGCNARDFTGPNEQGLTVRPTSVTVHYRVEGTYATCDITYRTPQNGTRVLTNTPLPWETAFYVSVDARTGAFPATLSATCLDPTRRGKSTSIILIDGVVKRRDGAEGPGATSSVSFQVGLDE